MTNPHTLAVHRTDASTIEDASIGLRGSIPYYLDEAISAATPTASEMGAAVRDAHKALDSLLDTIANAALAHLTFYALDETHRLDARIMAYEEAPTAASALAMIGTALRLADLLDILAALIAEEH